MVQAVIDDLSRGFPEAANGARWQMLSDQVMGGVSTGRLTRETVEGRRCNRMTGDVSLANNGGFLQMALDLSPDGQPVDASGFSVIEIAVRGNNEAYGLHLRTADITRPWQSYRQPFMATPEWQLIRLPLSGFEAHRIDAPLDVFSLRRIGLVAIGRAFTADLALADIRFA